MSSEDVSIRPFKISFSDAALQDLSKRLDLTRLPTRETVPDKSQGLQTSDLTSLLDFWRNHYSWRKCEDLLNSFPNYTTVIEGVAVHFLHIKSPIESPGTLPLLLTHGWPGSILEFRHVIDPFINPTNHDGAAADAFDLVIPCLPGFGFSAAPVTPGWDPSHIARVFIKLMHRLGYANKPWLAQGGDWGASITAAIGHEAPAGLVGIHLNSLYFDAKGEMSDASSCHRDVKGEPIPKSSEEARALQLEERFLSVEDAYAKQMGTRPQTVGVGLSDSPAGLAAWLMEKIDIWSDHAASPYKSGNNDGEARTTVDLFPGGWDEIIDDIMMYWLPNAATSAARLYWEKVDTTALEIPEAVGVGVSWFPGEQTYAPKEWATRYYRRITYWNDRISRGGHFAAWEQPELFVEEIRTWARTVR